MSNCPALISSEAERQETGTGWICGGEEEAGNLSQERGHCISLAAWCVGVLCIYYLLSYHLRVRWWNSPFTEAQGVRTTGQEQTHDLSRMC